MSSNTPFPQSQESQPIICTAETVMAKLWERTAPSLSQDELQWFAQSTEQAKSVIINMVPLVEGIGCLVASGDSAHSVEVGNYQNADDVPSLLFNIAHQLQTVAGLLHVGDDAAHRLYKPEAYAFEKKGGR